MNRLQFLRMSQRPPSSSTHPNSCSLKAISIPMICMTCLSREYFSVKLLSTSPLPCCKPAVIWPLLANLSAYSLHLNLARPGKHTQAVFAEIRSAGSQRSQRKRKEHRFVKDEKLLAFVVTSETQTMLYIWHTGTRVYKS